MDAKANESALERVCLPGHVLDLRQHELRGADGRPVELRRQAIDLLVYLGRHAGQVVSKRELLERVWAGAVVTDDSIVQAVSDARRAIADDAHRVIQTVPRRGYRLIPVPDSHSQPVLESVADDATAASADSPAPPTRRSGWRFSPRTMTIGIVVLASLGGLLGWQALRSNGFTARPSMVLPDRPPIAVLDFRDAQAAAEGNVLARGFAEDLTNELARNVDLRVIASHSSFEVAGMGEDLRRTAQRLGARYLVNGHLRRDAQQLRLSLQLIDGRDARVVWSTSHDMPASDVYTVRDAIVRRIAGTLHSTMRGNEEARAAQRPPVSLDIYEMTLRAIALKHRLSAQDSRDAKALLEHVVALDPGYAPGWLYLGFVNSLDTQHQLNGPYAADRMNLAVAQLERSLSLGGELPAAHLALSLSYLPLGRHDEAMSAVRRCLDLSPSDAECLMLYATLLVRVAGKPAEALPYARAALEVNPYPPSYVVHQHGLVLWANRDLDGALNALDESLRRAPGNLHARVTRLVTLAESGRIDDARAALSAMRGTSPLLMTADTMSALTFGPRAQPLIERRLHALELIGWPSAAAPTNAAPR